MTAPSRWTAQSSSKMDHQRVASWVARQLSYTARPIDLHVDVQKHGPSDIREDVSVTMTKEDPGWNYSLEDVWWPRFRHQTKRRGSGDSAEDDSCRTVPTEYYSRHQMLRTESPKYVLSPSSQRRKGAPIYSYRPGTTTIQAQKSWPTRAHDGSTEQIPTKQSSHSLNDGPQK